MGQLVGIEFGSDFYAEHEWGIKELQEIFGVQGKPSVRIESFSSQKEALKAIEDQEKKPFGLEARKITGMHGHQVWSNLPTGGTSVRTKDELGTSRSHTLWAVILQGDYLGGRPVHWGFFHPYFRDGLEVVALWSSREFGFATEDKSVVKEIMEAFARKDIALWVGPKRGLQSGGLILAIASRVPYDVQEAMADSDREQLEMQKAVIESGITFRLRQAHRDWFALSPHRANDGGLEFWVNPIEQDRYNWGWFKMQDLEDWVKGRGKIVKTA